MQISEKQRIVIEDALDAMACVLTSELTHIVDKYRRAISIVRTRPANTRKVRSDAGSKRK